MDSLNEFSKTIERLLVSEEQGNQIQQHNFDQQHDKRRERRDFFQSRSEQLMSAVIHPRVEQVVKHFENAIMPSSESPHTHCIYQFDCRPRSPASTTLSFIISHDIKVERLSITYALRIVPIFMKFEREDTISFLLESVNDAQCKAWVETKLLSFLGTYLQLGHIEQYQRSNMITDPVCGAQINKTFAIAQETTTGKKQYFCSQACRDDFIRNNGK